MPYATNTASDIDRLLEIMARLRDPQNGCPWDVKQSFETIAPYTIEEAYEVADAISRGNLNDLRSELGDLLLQVVFHSRMAEERHAFRFADVVDAISEKMIRRHPHVFGDARVRDAAEQTLAWESHKATERGDGSALDGVATALPALTRAMKLQKRAALVGFDWPDAMAALEKFREECAELGDEISGGGNPDRVEDEVGDLLFTCVNVARKLGIDPEKALRRANNKFERRFRRIEALLVDRGSKSNDLSIDELELLWQQAKIEEDGQINFSEEDGSG